MATIYYANQYVSTTLSGSIDASQTTSITLTSSTGVDTSKPGIAALTWSDPIDSDSIEWITYTSIAANVFQGVTRGAEGGTGRSHLNGAVVAFPISESHINAIADRLTGVDTVALSDTNGNELLKTSTTASAVNEFTIANAATGNGPTVSVTGGDTDIDMNINAKGAGKVKLDGYYQTPQTYTPSASGTATLDLSTGNEHRITMPAGNITTAVSNETDGQKFIVSILQDGTGSRTVTWFSTIRWAGGSAPTLTTTANKRDVFGFIVTGTDTYDGFVVGQNI